MGDFTQSLFNVALSWLRSLINSIWSIASSDTASSALEWIGKYWYMLVLLLAIGGVVVDYLVWLIRWRPFYVWASSWRRFKRRLTGKREDEAPKQVKQERIYQPPPEKAPRYPTPAYEDWDEPDDLGTTQQYAPVEKQPVFTSYTPAQEAPVYEEAPYFETEADAYDEGYDMGYDDAYYPPLEEPEPYAARTYKTPAAMPVERAPREPRQQHRRRSHNKVMSGFGNAASRLFAHNEEDEAEFVAYKAPKPRVTKGEAFHAPAYPPNWQAQQNVDFMEDEQ